MVNQSKNEESESKLIMPIQLQDKPSSTKRKNYLEWQEYFMSIAFLSAQRSKDPRTQVGACIVNQDNKIVGIGYNGMPIGCDDDKMPWNRAEDSTKEKWLNSKSPYVCHAELNAVLNKNLADINGCSIYVALFPCNMCAQIIIQSKIKEVVYYSDKYHQKPEFLASKRLLEMAGVKYRQFRPRQKKIVIDFELIEGVPSETPTLPKLPSYCNITSSTDKPQENGDTMNGNDNISDNHSSAIITTNNNNICIKRKTMSLGNHAEQQTLQQINELQFTTTAPLPPNVPDRVVETSMELKFAIVSWVLMMAFAVSMWYISASGLVKYPRQ